MTALALTDYNGLYGAVQFLQSAREAGIKPILGAEVTIKTIGKMVLLARSLQGYADLSRIISTAMMEDPKEPLILPENLPSHAGELFALLGTPLGYALEKSDTRQARRLTSACQDIFGKDRLMVELQNHGLPGDTARMEMLWNYARLNSLLPVATNNVHLLEPGDHFVHQALVAAARTVHHRDVQPRRNSEFYLKSGTQMARLFNGYGEALFNTELIAQECSLHLPLSVIRPPRMEMPDNMPAGDYLSRVCYQSLNKMFQKTRTPVARRLAGELQVIEDKGFSDYFLVVADLVRFARSQGIRHSCRGSASGSLVTYLLGISRVDPMENGLLFERFLNPERMDIPDIDVDFDSSRRDEVIDYAMEKYQGHAAMVATISRFRGRSAIREIGRAMGLSYEKLNLLVSAFRHMPASKIRETMIALPELRDSELRTEAYTKLLDVCARIDKFPRHMSVHLGGVVISREPIHTFSPVQRCRKGWPVLTFDKKDIETLGLIKTDLLGLRMLSAIEEADKLLQKQGRPIDLDNLNSRDPKVYGLLKKTDTLGCFQVESPGMRSLLGQLRPEKLSDLVSAISLFRPGPVQADMVSPYIARRTGRERYVLPHKALIPILDETYGVVLFQEQVLRIAHAIAGFSPGKGDLMRRAMKDPKSQTMQALKDDFLSGARAQGFNREIGEGIFSQLLTLAAFGFNKAHASAFARIVFQSLYLKVYHPAEFMVGVLNHLPGMYSERVLLHDARRSGVAILKPDINRSCAGYALENGAIRVGLRGVRQMGPVNLGRILEERSLGPFVDVADFKNRTGVNENLLTSLILAGVFDPLGLSRKQCLMDLKIDLRAGRKQASAEEDFSTHRKVGYELEYLGLDLTAHMISLYRKELDQIGVSRSVDLIKRGDGEKVAVAGMKILLHTPPTRSGVRVVFITLEDETGVCDVTVFPGTQELDAPILFTSDLLVVEGATHRRGTSISVNAERIFSLRDCVARKTGGVVCPQDPALNNRNKASHPQP